MAYQYFSSSHPQIDLSAIPGETRPSTAAPSFTTNVAAATGLLGVKEEFLGSITGGLQNGGVPSSRPAKKQKLAEEGRSHRFVSQKKWKFSDAQPWLPSKVSSKAQNASKSSSKAKKEPVSPRMPSPSSVFPHVTSADTRTAPVEIHTNHKSISNGSPHPSRSELIASSGRDQEDVSNLQSLPYNRPIPQRKSNPTPSSVAPSLSTTSSISKMNAPMPDSSPQGNVQAKTITSSTTDTEFNSASQSTLGKSRPSRSINALSLEKDAERIAALIAEKRKENESSMFRERMLKRQLEHKTYRDPHHASQDGLPAQSASPTQPLPDTQRYSEISDQGSMSNSSSTIVPSQRYLPSRQSTERSRTQDLRNSWNSSTVSQSSVGGLDDHTHTADSVPNSTSSNTLRSEAQSSPSHNEHEILFGRQSSSRALPAGMQAQSQKTFGILTTPIQSPITSMSFEAESGKVANQRAAFHNQMIQGASQGMQAQNSNNVRQMRPQYYSRQESSPLPNAQSETLRRTSSTTSLHRQPSVEASVGSVPSPMSISSQSPTSMSIRHFSQIDISTQPQAYSVAFPPTSDRGRTTSEGQLSMNSAAYYAMNRQMWTSSEQHFGPPMTTQAAHAGPLIRSNVASVIPNTATSRQQRYPQPPILASHTNMFSGNSRSSALVDPESVHAKPRVNMFSNTRGTAFPMQEVIRQIEMT